MSFVMSEVTVGNEPLWLEVVAIGPPAAGGPTPAGVTPADLLGKLESIGSAAGEACTTLFDKLHSALTGVKPDEITVEFGLALGGEASVPFVAKGTAEAAFKVSATWKTGGNV
jgi:hypothetical protein